MVLSAPLPTLLARCFMAGLFMAVLLAGIFSCWYLLYRAVKKFRWLRRPKEEREKIRALWEHPLSHASGRARTAYLILCLENALVHFGQTEDDWGWVLERLRALTEAPDKSFRPLFSVCQLLPVNILPYDRAEDISADPLYPWLADLWDGTAEVPEEDFLLLRALYIQAGWRMCVLGPLLSAIFRTAAASWTAGAGFSPDPLEQLELLEETEGLLEDWSIPLPRENRSDATAFLQNQAGPGWGKPFAGTAWSGFPGVKAPRDI